MAIKRLKSTARVAEVISVVSKAVDLLEKSPILTQDEYLSEKVGELKEMKAQGIAVMNTEKGSSALVEFDKKRDNAVRGVITLVHGYTMYPDEKLRTAAAGLEKIFAKYPKIITENYSKQTTLLDSLEVDLEKDDAKEAIELLPGVGALVEQLKTAADEFKAASAKKNADKVASSAITSVSSLKKPMMDLFNNDILQYLEAMSKAKKGAYKEAADLVSGEIDNANAEIARRIKVSEKKKGDEKKSDAI